MRRRNIAVLLFVSALLIVVYLANRPDTPTDDQGAAPDHDGSVETAISVQHADSTHDVVLTSHKVWIRNSEYATIIHRDTIPSLDSLSATAENKDGDTQQVRLKKDYQLFITVK